MLAEIYCEEFHQKKIEFSNTLNVVLGTNTGDNSIGKSTFMLIVDFAFGGTTYAEASDILDHITFAGTILTPIPCGYVMIKGNSKILSH